MSPESKIFRKEQDTRMSRIPRSEMLEQEFMEAAFEGKWLSDLVRKGAQVMLQKALEWEVEEYLGRGHYEHTRETFRGHRNGYEKTKLATGEGPIELGIPQLRAHEGFQSLILEHWKKRTEAVDRMIPAMYVKGLSQRDTEAVLKETLGNPGCSRSTVSRVCQSLVTTFESWKNRDLSTYAILYLFLDAIYLPVRQESKEKEGVLAAYAMTVEGKKVLLHLALGQRESTDAWMSFLQDMKQRGVREPLLVVMDGNSALKKSVGEMFPNALRQRCLAHKMRNILCKLPRKVQAEMKRLIQRCFNATGYSKGKTMAEELIRTWKDRYPSAMECLEKDLEECLTFLRFPKEHGKRIRTTNVLERLFGEGRRRTKVIPRFPKEQSALSLLHSVLVDASKKWRGIQMNRQIEQQLWVLWLEQYPEAQPDHARRAA